MRFKKVLRLLAIIIICVAAFMFVPAITALVLKETSSFIAFILTISLMAVFSTISLFVTKNEDKTLLTTRDALMFTSLTWIIATAFGSLPLLFTKTCSTFSDSFFEVMSGFTTTGASRIADVEICSKSILLWRSMTNWLGGMGIVVLFVALLPALGLGADSFNLMGTETVGPVKGKLTPKTRTTAMALWGIYCLFTILETVLLMAGGLSFFDSLTTSFSTVSTAGFSVKNHSIGAYSNPYVEVVVSVFMFLAAVNFSLYFLIFTGKIKEALKDVELRIFVGIVAVLTLFGALYLFIDKVYPSFGDCLRYMFFHVASLISTTGFTSANFLNWPAFPVMLLIVTFFIGGCAGSTGGGMKVIRIAVVFKSSVNTIKKRIFPKSVCHVRIGDSIIEEETVFSILTFCCLYIATWVIGCLVISFTGISIADCFSSVLLTLGNIGAGFTSLQFTTLPIWTDWVFIFLMLIGRLELFTIFVLFSKNFYK